MLKYTKYLLLSIVVACSSKETEYKDLAITHLKTFLLDPKSFELINYQLDTIRLSYQVQEELFRVRDIIESNIIDTTCCDPEIWLDSLRSRKDRVTEMLILLDKLDSNPSLNTPIGYQSVVRYYYTRANRERVIHTIGINHDMNGNVLEEISILDDKSYIFK